MHEGGNRFHSNSPQKKFSKFRRHALENETLQSSAFGVQIVARWILHAELAGKKGLQPIATPIRFAGPKQVSSLW
ncbi:hypothetical protein Poly59_34200 [Rubripirellula reticaptiva]|uniref:Uncharacterized protein n=1 Tax=Rubripirellula reticaptiva TaxID=2528013 RepID=A0A5C6ET26_9BACT|nr:hypothetical protein Poly59_34200 [Rubripirellula reticaptiva]